MCAILQQEKKGKKSENQYILKGFKIGHSPIYFRSPLKRLLQSFLGPILVFRSHIGLILIFCYIRSYSLQIMITARAFTVCAPPVFSKY